MAGTERTWTNARTFLGALLRDVRANTVTIMAISLIPWRAWSAAASTSAACTSSRRACNTPVTPARSRAQGDGWRHLEPSNYAQGTVAPRNSSKPITSPTAYGASGVTKAFTENAGKVSGTASAELPMTLMRIFGRTTETLTVTCDAEMRLPNTDVMFVLDTTGSMGDKAVSGHRRQDRPR
jgi:hypothetical protein